MFTKEKLAICREIHNEEMGIKYGYIRGLLSPDIEHTGEIVLINKRFAGSNLKTDGFESSFHQRSFNNFL